MFSIPLRKQICLSASVKSLSKWDSTSAFKENNAVKFNLEKHSYVTIICHNDDLSLSFTWLDCLLITSEGFIFFAEINQVLLKISFLPIILTFMYVCSSTLSENWVVHNFKSNSNSTQSSLWEINVAFFSYKEISANL